MTQSIAFNQKAHPRATLNNKVIDDITIIIPTVGRPILEDCLEALVNGNVLPAYIIVIDQGENLDVAKWIRIVETKSVDILHIQHIRSAGRSPSSARNEGLAQTRTSFVASIDDDCLAKEDWLENMSYLLHRNPSAIITGQVMPAGKGSPPSLETSTKARQYFHPSIRVPSSTIASGNMGFSLNIAKKIGPFDTNLFTAEDNDWGYRALKLGIPVFYEPSTTVYHYHWRNQSDLFEVYKSYALGQGGFYGKHLRNKDWSMILRALLTFYRGCKSLVQGLITKDQNSYFDGIARIAWLLPGIVNGYRGFKSSKNH